MNPREGRQHVTDSGRANRLLSPLKRLERGLMSSGIVSPCLEKMEMTASIRDPNRLDMKFGAKEDIMSVSNRAGSSRRPRVVMLLRALTHTIGLGMLAVSRAKTAMKVRGDEDKDVKIKTFGYFVDPNVFNPRRSLKLGEEFGVFLTQIEGAPATFALQSNLLHKWVISLLGQDESAATESVFQNSVEKDLLLTCTFSVIESRIVIRRIGILTPGKDDTVVIKDFKRLVAMPDVVHDFDPSVKSEFVIGTVPLASFQDLRDLPREVTATIIDIAVRTLRIYCYPRCMLWIQKRARARMVDAGAKSCPNVTVDVMQKQSMFKMWPQNLLEECVKSLSLVSFGAGELIIHEDEQAGSGIFFLMQGQVSVWKKISKSKSIGPGNTKKWCDMNPPMCFGEFAFLTEEPRTASVRANSRVDLWVMKKHDFHRIFKALPRDLLSTVIQVSFAKRNASLHTAHPMTIDILKSYSIFKVCSDKVLEQIKSHLRPFAIPKEYVLFREGEPGIQFYFLRTGKCSVYQNVDASEKAGPKETHVKTLSAGEMLGDDAVLYNGCYTLTVKTITNCDLWALSKEHFDYIMSSTGLQLQKMMGEAQLQRQSKLSLQQMRFRELIENIPILSSLMPKSAFRELLNEFQARVYKPRHLFCSTAHFADRLIVLTKGRIKFVNQGKTGGEFAKGECIGYTCIVPHRWAMTAMTLDIVEVLELPVEAYEAFLRKHNMYATVEKICRALMFPRSCDEKEIVSAWEMISAMKTPLTFPMSLTPVFNPHEYMFGLIGAPDGAISATRRPQAQTQHQLAPIVQRPHHHVAGSALWIQRPQTTVPKRRLHNKTM